MVEGGGGGEVLMGEGGGGVDGVGKGEELEGDGKGGIDHPGSSSARHEEIQGVRLP